MAILLLSFSNFAIAEWVHASRGIPTKHDDYYDSKSITFNNGIVKLDRLRNFEVSTKFSDKSEIATVEINCNTSELRILKSIYFTENMGLGKASFNSEKQTEWDKITESSVSQKLQRIVCVEFFSTQKYQ